MILQIQEIKSPGDLERERIIMRVVLDGKTNNYVLLRARADHRMVYGGTGNFYWLSNGDVAGGDQVIVYSKAGKSKKKVSADGHTSHFHYWGSNTSLWDGAFGCVLLLAHPRQAFRIGGFDKSDDIEPDDEVE